jgi:hypothetical protein
VGVDDTADTTAPGAGREAAMSRATATARVPLWTLVPVTVVAVASLAVGLWLLLVTLGAARGVGAYQRGAVDDAAAVFAAQRNLPALDAWRADFDEGTALLATVDPDDLATDPGAHLGTVSDAADLLDAASVAAAGEGPEVVCTVSTNAAIAHERLAVAHAADESHAAAAHDFDRAAALRASPACGAAGMPERQERNDRAAQEDRRRAERARASAGEPRPSPSLEADPAERQRQDELGRLDEEALRALDEERQSQSSDGEGEAPASDTAKPW